MPHSKVLVRITLSFQVPIALSFHAVQGASVNMWRWSVGDFELRVALWTGIKVRWFTWALVLHSRWQCIRKCLDNPSNGLCPGTFPLRTESLSILSSRFLFYVLLLQGWAFHGIFLKGFLTDLQGVVGNDIKLLNASNCRAFCWAPSIYTAYSACLRCTLCNQSLPNG